MGLGLGLGLARRLESSAQGLISMYWEWLAPASAAGTGDTVTAVWAVLLYLGQSLLCAFVYLCVYTLRTLLFHHYGDE